ncbi:MAG: phosphoribosylformylglycinamidine synthase [Deltaproteobacteria bacterium]|nr:phosphoribosylformylglycinamidine synthase [Deltaproteobacteria bacterium]
MAHRIEVALKPNIRDAQGEKTARRIREDLLLEIQRVAVVEVYTIDAGLSDAELEGLAAGPFSDPIIHYWSVDKPAAHDFDWLIEVGFKPGVTDNAGRTAREAIEFFLDRRLDKEEGVYTSRQYLIKGNQTRRQIETIARDLLANELIQRFIILSWDEFDQENGIQATVPKVIERIEPRVETIDLELDDQGLMELSRRRLLALSLEEMRAIKDYYLRDDVMKRREIAGLAKGPTDVELECIAQTWSEHCKHKIFNAEIKYTDENGERTIDSLFDTYIRGTTKKVRAAVGQEDYCKSVFEDNAGVIKFNDDWDLVFKVETHNSPSALDPYGGALTGIVGVNRDPFGTGKGAKLIFNTDVFCFASPFYNGELPKGLLHPRRILEGVREGVEHGGNKSGIPTVNGSVLFDDRYLGKPLVYCGTGGLLPARLHGEPGWKKDVKPGDRIVMTGGRIGKDGIHGATFSSEELNEGSPATAVQIGDPITQKRMTDFLLRARDENLYRCITDNGAGGLSSSVGETARMSGGADLYLDRPPLKYPGLMPWEIFLSEAQERMTLAVPADKLDRLMDLAKSMEVEATDLGEYNDAGFLRCYFQGDLVAELDMDFLHDGVPKMRIEAVFEPPPRAKPDYQPPKDLADELLVMLGRLNICSKHYWVRQYDHEVQGGSVVKPLVGSRDHGPSDAAVLRPLLDSMEAVVVAHGICPRYSDIDTYDMAANAVDEAVRNAISVGADPARLAALDNFCWCDPIQSKKNPDGKHKLAQLVRACNGVYDVCTTYGIPLISGKDSMKNDAVIEGRRISIPPTLLISLLGKIEDAETAVTMDAKAEGDVVFMLGMTRPELGASEYYAMKGSIGNSIPRVDPEAFFEMYKAFHLAIREGLLASCHDCSDGGLAVALAETALAGDLGMNLDLSGIPQDGITRPEQLLFSESAGRFVVTTHPEKAGRFEELMRGFPVSELGLVTSDRSFNLKGLPLGGGLETTIDDIEKAWKATLDF